MTIILYIVWWGLPVLFLLIALYERLEQYSGKKQHERPMDYLKQSLFLFLAAGVTTIIDVYFLKGISDAINIEMIPFVFYQIILYPVVLFVAAKFIGGSQPIRIEKVTHVSKRKKNRK